MGAIAGPIVTGAIVALSGSDPGRSLFALGLLALSPAGIVLLVPKREA